MSISASTPICAVIGDPVSHSLSPQLHNAAFQACGLDMVYVAFHVRRGDTRRALEGVRSLQIRGLSVTIPHKVDVIPFLDDIDEGAEHVGSINTVVNQDGHLTGYSTDGPGALRALEAEGVDPTNRHILILGSGGAARAVAFSLAVLNNPPGLSILGVVTAELDQLCLDLRSRTSVEVSGRLLSPSILEEALSEAEIVVHATPIGMAPKDNESLVPAELIRPDHVVFDAVYTPFETRLLREASEAGAVTIPGLGMFVHQAAIQFELWTGQEAPLSIMTDTVKAALGGGQ